MMNIKTEHTIFQGIAIRRRHLIELILITILLAFGVNLIVDQLLYLAVVGPVITIAVGFLICFFSILYFVASLVGNRSEKRTYRAFFLYDKNKNDILYIPRYEFSEISEYLKNAFYENPTLKTLWEKESLKNTFQPDTTELDIQSVKLILEAAEYFILSKLSTHLTDYFADKRFKKNELKTYERKDIPEVLLTNRFLEIFSRSIEERPVFSKDNTEDDLPGTLYGSYEIGGARYERFELILPKKSCVRRSESQKIEINTKKLKIVIGTYFERTCTCLPDNFLEYYLKLKNPWKNIIEYELNIDIEVIAKLRCLFSKTGWEYYQWVDSFLEQIEKDVSEEKFFELINWESSLTLLECIKKEK